MQINDPPTAAQFAVAIERLVNLSEDVKEIRGSQKRLESALVEVPLLKKELEHLSDSFRQLHAMAEVRASNHHRMDKRLTALEWWHKYRLAQPALVIAIALASWSYWQGFTSAIDDFKNATNNRVSSLEFIINSPHFERAMATDNRPVAEGSKD